jgi:tetratricopeptide (TPR) repeat protein
MENSVNEDKSKIHSSAQIYCDIGEFDKALIEYQKLLAMDPDDMESIVAVGDIYHIKNSMELAYEFYNKAALAYVIQNQPDKTLSIYKKITDLDAAKLPANIQAQINYAHAYLKIDAALKEDQIEPAIELIGKVLKFRPEDMLIQIQSAVLNEKISKMPASIQTYQTLGDAFSKNNMLQKAQEMFAKITEIDPQNPAARLHMAQVYLKQGSESEAKKEYLHLAEEAFDKGNFNQAYDFAQKAIELKSVEARYISGLINFKREKFEEAVSEFEAILRFKVNHLGALINLGKALDMLGRLEKARATFQKALEMDNENPEVQEAWIEFCVRTKNIDQALPNLTSILQKAVTGNNAEQIAKFSKLMLRLEPDNASTHVKLIESLKTLGDSNGAAEALYRFAMIHERKKRFEEAVQCLEEALLLSPANTPAIEKALDRIDFKGARSGGDGTSPAVDKPIVFENSDFWGEVHPLEANLSEFFDAPLTETVHVIDDPLTLANLCVQQGYFKAAIEIYQQFLEKNPGSEEARKKLTEVSAIYLKKLTGSK